MITSSAHSSHHINVFGVVLADVEFTPYTVSFTNLLACCTAELSTVLFEDLLLIKTGMFGQQ